MARHLDVYTDVLPPGQVHEAGAGAGLDHALARQQRDRPDAVLGRLDLLEVIQSLNRAHLTDGENNFVKTVAIKIFICLPRGATPAISTNLELQLYFIVLKRLLLLFLFVT